MPGLAIHDTSPTPIEPIQPTGLGAMPKWGSSVSLSWDRNGNSQGVKFIIEAMPQGGTWGKVGVTTKGSTNIYGFAQGVPFWFRVRAENRGNQSHPRTKFPSTPPRKLRKCCRLLRSSFQVSWRATTTDRSLVSHGLRSTLGGGQVTLNLLHIVVASPRGMS